MDTERFDHLSPVLTSSSSRRQALRALTGLAGALALAGALGADVSEAGRKKRKKGKKKKKGGKGNSGGNTGGNSGSGGNSGDGSGNGNGDGGNTGGDGKTDGGGGTATSEEDLLFRMVNDLRSHYGLAALTRNNKLDTAALLHSQDMAKRGYFAHNTPEGITPDQRMTAAGYSFSWWGENIYKSAPGDASAQSAYDSWSHSPGHRANMLGSNFTHIGIGRATATDGRTYWTNVFGKPA